MAANEFDVVDVLGLGDAGARREQHPQRAPQLEQKRYAMALLQADDKGFRLKRNALQSVNGSVSPVAL